MTMCDYTVMVKRANSLSFYLAIRAASENGALNIALKKIRWEDGTKLTVVDNEKHKDMISANLSEMKEWK